jgi:hypothetical protein
MNTLAHDNPQIGPYWRGFCLGALTTALAFLAVEKVSSTPDLASPSLIPQDIVAAYNMGLKDSLRTNPPSLDLEQTCVNMWADKQPVREP